MHAGRWHPSRSSWRWRPPKVLTTSTASTCSRPSPSMVTLPMDTPRDKPFKRWKKWQKQVCPWVTPTNTLGSRAKNNRLVATPPPLSLVFASSSSICCSQRNMRAISCLSPCSSPCLSVCSVRSFSSKASAVWVYFPERLVRLWEQCLVKRKTISTCRLPWLCLSVCWPKMRFSS